MRAIKLIGPTSFRAFRCVWMLEELGVPYVHEPAAPWTEEAMKYHPLGKIPSLIVGSNDEDEEDGDFVMYESAAINTYLGDLFGQFVPTAGTRQRGRYDQTVMCLMTELDAQGLWIHRKHDALGKLYGTLPEAVVEAKRQYTNVQKCMMTQLKHPGPYLVGAEFTAADILYVHCLNWAKVIGWLEEKDADPELRDYLERCRSRPAYLRTVDKRREEGKQQQMQKDQAKI